MVTAWEILMLLSWFSQHSTWFVISEYPYYIFLSTGQIIKCTTRIHMSPNYKKTSTNPGLGSMVMFFRIFLS